MKAVLLSYLDERVRRVFDEIGVNVADLIDNDIDSENLSEIIRDKVHESVRHVHSTANYELLYDAIDATQGATVAVAADKVARIEVPSDFLRLVKLKMSGWIYPVHVTFSEMNAEYHKQKDYYARGVWQKPKAFLVATGSGARAIEGYSCKTSSDTLESFMYVPDNDIYIDNNEQEAINICERCEDAIVYQTALLALSSYKDVQGRELLPQLILQYSGIEPAQQPKTQRR
jgi:hypothetical protein